MRNLTLLVVLVSLFFCVLGKSVFQQYPKQQESLLSPLDSNKVPGESPVQICSLSPSDDLVDIKYIDINPNPPQAGKNLTIDAMGKLKVDIEEGAYALFEVKYGFIKLLSGTADICEKALEVDLECPLKEGEIIKVLKTVSLPSRIPPVYSVLN
jgi:hypothetical protein